MIFTSNKNESHGSCFHGTSSQVGNARHLKIITKTIMSDPAQGEIKACAGELMKKRQLLTTRKSIKKESMTVQHYL